MDRMLLAGGADLAEESYIDGLGGSDFHYLSGLATQVALDRRPSSVIRLVYGATKEMPLRALSYLLPALTYMQSNRDFISQLQVIFVNNISSRLDGINTQVASKEARQFAEVAQDYISQFFPNLADNTVFLEDTPLDKGSDLRERLLSVTLSLRNLAPEDLLDDLVKKAANNGGGRTYAFYGAAHVLIHDIDIPGSLVPMLFDQPEVVTNPDVIVSIGGKKEETFYRLRHALKPHISPEYSRVKTLQFFTRHNVPPYYMARGKDLALRVVLDNPSINHKGITAVARRDIEYLQRVSSARGDLEAFFARQIR